ncbi:MAG: hypothetical protein R6U10_02370 [Thermoplasmatota archaeon]
MEDKKMKGKIIAIAIVGVFAAAGMTGMLATGKGPGNGNGNGAFDQWGYNYQAHIYNGWYDNYQKPEPPAEHEWGEAGATWLIMKWNDAWLSNKDRDGDGELDRHWGYESYIGSGAWCTNHMIGWYENDDGEICQWEYFVKIVAVPEDAEKQEIDGEDYWYTADGTEIGPSIWGQFAVIQRVYNDPCGGYHGIEYLSPTSAGLGYYR